MVGKARNDPHLLRKTKSVYLVPVKREAPGALLGAVSSLLAKVINFSNSQWNFIKCLTLLLHSSKSLFQPINVMDNTLPEKTRSSLDGFCDQLEQALGSKFVSGVLYGKLARDINKTADMSVNFMVVLEEISTANLDAVGDALRKSKVQIELLTLSEEDLRSSTDVFPIKFLDIKRTHVIYRGKDVMSQLEISKDNLRLRCEQEIKNLMLRLRLNYVSRKQNSKSIASLLSRIYLSLIRNLGVLVELKSGDVLATNSDIIKGAGKLGIDTVVLHDVEKLRQDNFSQDLEDRKRLLEKVMQCVRDAAAMVDKL